MIEPENLYDSHREAVKNFLGEDMQEWHELTFAEKCEWQAQADELNEARREDAKS